MKAFARPREDGTTVYEVWIVDEQGEKVAIVAENISDYNSAIELIQQREIG